MEPSEHGPAANRPRRRRLGPYRLVRCLGSGAFARVYAAIRQGDGAWVAVKVLPPGEECSDLVRQRLQVEGHLALGIDHPNLVRYLDVGEDDGFVYVVQELVDGGDITALIAAHRGKVPPLIIAAIGRDAARGLDELHRCGLLHRDIKPANLLLTRSGTCKIADLGLLRPLREHSTLTAPGIVVGTPSFIAPEQIRNDQRLGPRADLYGLAASLYWLATCQTPHQAPNLWTMLSRSVAEPFPDPRIVRPDLPEGLAKAILVAGDKDPDRRHPTAAALAEDFEDILAGRLPRLANLAVELRPVAALPARDPASRVLMIGGDPLFRRLYAGRLVVDGWQVEIADALDAVASACSRRPPAVVILDLGNAGAVSLGQVRALPGMAMVPMVVMAGAAGGPPPGPGGATRVVDKGTTSPREFSLLVGRLIARPGVAEESTLPIAGLTHAALDHMRPLLGDLGGPLPDPVLDELATSARGLACLATTVGLPAAAAMAEAVEMLARHLRCDGSATAEAKSTLKQGVDTLIAVITAQHPGPAWPPRRILILKSEPVAQRFVLLALSRFRLPAVCMRDEDDAVEEAEADAPALVLADTRCVADQRAFIDAVHRCGPIPVVLVLQAEDLASLVTGPGVDRLLLPYSAAELVVRLIINLVLPVA